MIAGFTLINAFNWFRSSLPAQIASAVLAVFGVYFFVDARGQSKGVQKVVQASKVAGEKRNEASDKIRNAIKPGTAWSRLQSEYADGR